MKKLGVLCHVSSLPNDYGIGDFGECCHYFIDFLEQYNINIWQILPLSNTNDSNCPYGAMSSLTFDEQYISPEYLVFLGLVDEEELNTLKKLKNSKKVRFDIVKPEKLRLLSLAYKNAKKPMMDRVCAFAEEHPEFYDYGYYKALLSVHNVNDWHLVPHVLWKKGSKEYKAFVKENEKEIYKHIFSQYLLYSEWQTVKDYASMHNVEILGDMPIYPDKTSLDVLFNLDKFKLDGEYMPRVTGGVPPDDFSDVMQNWGTCIYDWDKLKEDNYSWIIKKISALQSYYDIVRIDHFAGFVEHYEIDNNDYSKNKWVKGGGEDLFNVIADKCDIDRLVIEDLGIVKPEHKKIRDKYNLSGMAIMQFAFKRPNHEYLPENVGENTLYYLGTHDNNTYLGFLRKLDRAKKKKVFEYLGLRKMGHKQLVIASVKKMLDSKCKAVILQMQDYLLQNEKHKMNTPGKADGCWDYRVPSNYEKIFAKNIKLFTE